MAFSQLARPLLFLHLLGAVALLAVTSHAMWAALSAALGRVRPRLLKVHAGLIGALLPLSFTLGLLMYPHYRYAVRSLYLDEHAPWASNLFDLKENLAAFALPLALAMWGVGRRASVAAELRPLYAVLSVCCWALVVLAAVMGFVVTHVKALS